MKQKRMLHYDLLRIVAAFSVVMLHCAAQFWYTLELHSTEWLIANAYDAVFRFGVPIFVMLSGVLFLNPDYTLNIKRLYTHNILRMIVLYIVWSCLYGLYDCTRFDIKAAGIKNVLREMLAGRYHLWFLPMIVGIYVLLPILKSWVTHASKQNIQYFLALFFILKIGTETIRALTVMDELHEILDKTQVPLICSYVGYFVWGYYLAHVGVSKKFKTWIYRLTLPAIVCNVVFGTWMSWRLDAPNGAVFDSYSVFTFIVVTAIFLFTLDKGKQLSFHARQEAVIKELSADTLGVYVMHIGVIEILEHAGIHCMLLPIWIGIPLLAVGVFALTVILAALLRRIPKIGTYLC